MVIFTRVRKNLFLIFLLGLTCYSLACSSPIPGGQPLPPTSAAARQQAALSMDSMLSSQLAEMLKKPPPSQSWTYSNAYYSAGSKLQAAKNGLYNGASYVYNSAKSAAVYGKDTVASAIMLPKTAATKALEGVGYYVGVGMGQGVAQATKQELPSVQKAVTTSVNEVIKSSAKQIAKEADNLSPHVQKLSKTAGENVVGGAVNGLTNNQPAIRGLVQDTGEAVVGGAVDGLTHYKPAIRGLAKDTGKAVVEVAGNKALKKAAIVAGGAAAFYGGYKFVDVAADLKNATNRKSSLYS